MPRRDRHPTLLEAARRGDDGSRDYSPGDIENEQLSLPADQERGRRSTGSRGKSVLTFGILGAGAVITALGIYFVRTPEIAHSWQIASVIPGRAPAPSPAPILVAASAPTVIPAPSPAPAAVVASTPTAAPAPGVPPAAASAIVASLDTIVPAPAPQVGIAAAPMASGSTRQVTTTESVRLSPLPVASALEPPLDPLPPPATAAAPPPAPFNPPGPARQGQSKAEIQALTAQARKLIDTGDIAAARLLLERATAGEDGEALFALAETYDPNVLAQWRVRGVRGNPERAHALYERALTRGVGRAQARMVALLR